MASFFHFKKKKELTSPESRGAGRPDPSAAGSSHLIQEHAQQLTPTPSSRAGLALESTQPLPGRGVSVHCLRPQNPARASHEIPPPPLCFALQRRRAPPELYATMLATPLRYSTEIITGCHDAPPGFKFQIVPGAATRRCLSLVGA
ncbi:hypothetical protein PR202_gb12453 [Eleusine coracana subsp. coracana]|uniref:Uncharacterized protein n=1 Tax=Eleusine coracana subsp. coracana TaxID=191504 RepID=A0AAV5EQK4_ELECO|nr:hypothetical protein PR202_gb12453 [Eleusine coracana subsp. coracana]